jgi:hypothetical protein
MSEPESNNPLDEVVVRNVDALVHREDPGQFTLHLKPEWWRAVSIIGSSHLSDPDVTRFTAAFRWLGVMAVYAVALELRDSIETVRRFPATEAGLKAFNRATSHFNYALTTYDCTALVVCTTDDYMVVCGPEQFVRLALGREPDEAMEEFHQWGTDPWWPATTRKVFESVWSAFVNPGPVVVFPGWVAKPKGTS